LSTEYKSGDASFYGLLFLATKTTGKCYERVNRAVISYSQGNEDIYNNCHNLLNHIVP